MIALRRRLRLWATVSLLLQTAWLFVLVPGSCCAMHDKAETTPACHEETPATHCPLKATSGAACPMHGGGHAAEHRERCTMQRGCDGPMSALATLLSAHGVLPEAFELIAESRHSAAPPPDREQPFGLLSAPDSPPPRA
jgi:hypothetical protein